MKRFEQKYLLDSININNVLKKINAKPVYNSRWINSIYYDTKDFILYNESVEGTVPRKKIRFRWYGQNKNKNKNNQNGTIEVKTTFQFHRDKSSIKVANVSQKEINFECNNFLGLSCFPVTQVSFYRKYYEAPKKIRVTIDKAIKFQNFGDNIQRNTSLYPYDIFEIKMPIENDVSSIQSMLGDKNTRFSKYCLSIETLKNINLNSNL